MVAGDGTERLCVEYAVLALAEEAQVVQLICFVSIRHQSLMEEVGTECPRVELAVLALAGVQH